MAGVQKCNHLFKKLHSPSMNPSQCISFFFHTDPHNVCCHAQCLYCNYLNAVFFFYFCILLFDKPGAKNCSSVLQVYLSVELSNCVYIHIHYIHSPRDGVLEILIEYYRVGCCAVRKLCPCLGHNSAFWTLWDLLSKTFENKDQTCKSCNRSSLKLSQVVSQVCTLLLIFVS